MHLLVFLLLLSAATQPVHRPRLPEIRQLSVTSAKTLEMPFFSFYGESQSDEDGNIYYHAGNGHFNNCTILAITPKAAEPVAYALPASLAKSTYFYAFSVSRSGRVYVIAQDDDHKYWLFAFRHDGDLARQTELELPALVHLSQFAVFDSTENIMASGYYDGTAPVPKQGKGVVLLFNSSGQLLRTVGDTPDVDLQTAGRVPEEGYFYVADDGNLYVLTGKDILVFSESGALQRTIWIDKPEKAYAVQLQVAHGVAAVWFNSVPAKDGPIELSLETIDLNSATITAIYHPDDDLGNNAVYFSPNDGFTFMTNKDGRIRLLFAALR